MPPEDIMLNATLHFEGKVCRTLPVRDSLVLGRGHEADAQIADHAVSRRHCAIEKTTDGWRVRDLNSRTGTFVNGRLFQQHDLVYGDLLQLGDCALRFDGGALVRVPAKGGASLAADDVTKTVGGRAILRGISLRVESGKFAGILGTSGAGKSTLLDGLSGIRPVSSGKILLGDVDLRAFLRQGSTACGYVPQDDIVHTSLTVAEALRFSARLRLPGNVPPHELEKLVRQTINQLGLSERADVRIHRLSGGQRKRVSIAAEVLARPEILFLDEPSSGLDPATEFKLMELLRDLANLGCTVVCTTHVMENVYLFDQLIVIVAGRLVFSGAPQQAREHFAIERFATLYDRLEEYPPDYWVEKFTAVSETHVPMHPRSAPPQSGKRTVPSPFFRIQLARQWAILSSDVKNFILLLGQPIIIGLLVAWMADNVPFKLFLAYLGTFWFGCSNAAQEIVKEISIYRRERIVGLGRNAYLLSKFTFLGSVTVLQALLLYVCVLFGSKTVTGSAELQLGCLFVTAISAVGIGTAISALVRTVTQAVMIVPLVLLPQIVLSGFVLSPFKDNSEGKSVKKPIYEFVPSHASQTIMDVSVFWQEKLTPEYVHPLDKFGVRLKNADPEARFKPGDTFDNSAPASIAMVKLLAWAFLSYLIALMALVSKERAK